MEAKDTVMSGAEEINGTLFLPSDYISWREHQNLMEAQAEISFKAGQEEQPRTPRTDLENELADKEFAKLYRKARIKTQREIDLCLEARLAEIRGVVEWIDSLPDWVGRDGETGEFFIKGKLLPITDWQAFKKERGL